MDGITLVVELTLPIGIIVDAVLVLGGNIAVALVGRLLAMRVLEVRLEVVGAGEGRRLAALDPALEKAMLALLMHGLFVSLLVLLALEALLLACLFVDAARVAAGKLILGDDHFTVDARVRHLGRLGLGRQAEIALAFITAA